MGIKSKHPNWRKPPIQTQIKKGEVRNPKGAGAHKRVAVRGELRRLTAKEVEELGSLLLKGDLKALRKAISNPQSTVLTVWIAKAAQKAVKKGDLSTLDVLFERLIGKVPNKIEATGKNGAPLALNGPQVIVTIPSNGREAKTIETPKKLEEPK